MDFALNRNVAICGEQQDKQEEVYYANVDDVKELVGKIQQKYKLYYKLKEHVDGQYRIVAGKNGAIAYQKEGATDPKGELDIVSVESDALCVSTNYLPNVTKNFVQFNKFSGISQTLNSTSDIVINLNNIFVCTEEQLKEMSKRNSISFFVQ